MFLVFYQTAEGKDNVDKVTFRELKARVAQYAAAMRKMGIKTGDRVVGKYIYQLLG